MAHTLAEQVALDQTGPDTFVSRVNPLHMGNAANIAYGGCAIGLAIQAACKTTKPGYFLYTALGTYLGPALTDRRVHCSVRRLRDTRTFATRQVELSQVQDDGTTRLCMAILADFQVREPASMYAYSAPPRRAYSAPDACPDSKAAAAAMVARGLLTPEGERQFGVMHGRKDRFMETRLCPEGVAAQNLSGLVPDVKTTQDGLAATEKTTANWTRVRHAMPDPNDRYAGLGFIMDEALSFWPLTLHNKGLHDAAACSSLDFSLRFFREDFDLTKWHLREWVTIAAAGGRTYTESRLWDEDGNMVADMTQQSILRPKPGLIKASL
jgi:acyl-CoA thioesterase II